MFTALFIFILPLLFPSGNHFSIDSTTGTISTRVPLDRESIAAFRLQIKASDNEPDPRLRRHALKTIDVVVVDVNDNRPVFVSPAAIPVHEDARRGQQILKIAATDADEPGPNSTLVYSYVSGNAGMFLLNSRTGELTLNADFAGVKRTFDLVIEAADQCVSTSGRRDCALKETFKFTIFPESSYSRGLSFADNFYEGQVAENQPSGALIGAIRATYTDGRSTKDVQYFASYVWNAANDEMQPALFEIDRHRGIVSTRQPGIDRERGAAKYVLDIYAVDLSSGPFPLSVKTQMNIYILDRNDEPPVFTRSVYEARAKEDIVPGRIVASVKAEDEDENGVITYR